MAVAFNKLVTPTSDDYTVETPHTNIAVGLGVFGIMVGMAVAAIALVAANDLEGGNAAQLLAYAFGLQTTALVTMKLAIAAALVGILVRLWLRIEGVKESLGALQPTEHGPGPSLGDVHTDFGDATVTKGVPEPLPIHNMARTMWFPMIAMGPMFVVAGLITSIVWGNNVGTETGVSASGWTQGLQFLGEGLVLAGISFLLGSILGSLREGGADVQKALGLNVITLKMPATAKAFVALMATGLMISMVQLGLYIYTVTGLNADSFAEIAPWWAWMGAFRELGLALLLAGIVLALATIANVLGFQFSRIRSIASTGE